MPSRSNRFRKALAVLAFLIGIALIGNAFVAVLGRFGVLPTLTEQMPFIAGGPWWPLYFAASAGGIVLAVYLRVIARRLNVPIFSSLDEMVAAAGRRPIILFLREFSSDSTRGVRNDANLQNLFMKEEEGIAKALRLFGYVVAIGRPGEALPPGGGARFHVSDARWQKVVGRLIGLSALIVMRVGASPGISWEIEQIVAKHKVDRTIFVPWHGNVASTAAAFERLQTVLGPWVNVDVPVPASLKAMHGQWEQMEALALRGAASAERSIEDFDQDDPMRETSKEFRRLSLDIAASAREAQQAKLLAPTLMIKQGKRFDTVHGSIAEAIPKAARMLGLTARLDWRMFPLAAFSLLCLLACASAIIFFGCEMAEMKQCVDTMKDIANSVVLSATIGLILMLVAVEFF